MTRTAGLRGWALLVAIAGGVLLFGAVYPWAYIPLLVAAAALGVYGWVTAAPRSRQPFLRLLPALLLVFAVALVQLIPLPIAWLVRLSPHSDLAAQRYDVAYSAARATGEATVHPMSIAPSNTLAGLAMFGALALFLAGTTASLPRLRLTWLIRRTTALGLAIALFGIVQKATSNGRVYWVWSPIESQGNGFGPFVNRNHFAGWMLMTACLATGYLCSLVRFGGRRRRSWHERVAALAAPDANRLLFTSCAVAVMALSIVWTMSRSGIGAFAIATSLFVALAAVRFRGSPRLAIAVGLIAIVLFALSWKGLGTMADWYGHTSTLEWRLDLWRDTAAIIRDFRWFGTGLNTYGVSTLLYPMTDPGWHAMEAHSDYVQIASEGGIALSLAAVCLVGQLARVIRAAFAKPQDRATYWMRAGATIGLVAIAIQELTDFSLQMPGNALLMVVLAAIAIHRPRRPWQPKPQNLAQPAS